MDPRLHIYLQHLLETAHHVKDVSSIPAPLAEKMLADLHIQLEQRLSTALIDELPVADQTAFVALAATDPTQAKMLEFLNAKVPNAAKVVQATLKKFEQDYITIVNRGTSHAH